MEGSHIIHKWEMTKKLLDCRIAVAVVVAVVVAVAVAIILVSLLKVLVYI